MSDPVQEARSKLDSAKREVETLNRRAQFAGALSAITDRVAKLRPMDAEIKQARARGWVWNPEMEQTHADLLRQADGVAAEVKRESATGAERFRTRIDQLEALVARTPASPGAIAQIDGIISQANDIEQDVQGVEARIEAATRPFVAPFDELVAALRTVDLHMDRFEAAKFKVGPGEHPWLTCAASWEDRPGGKVTGFVYLTDQRFRFEQKEAVATSTFLFFTTGSENKHELMIDEPVGKLKNSEDSTRGWVMKDQILTLQWGDGVRFPTTTFDFNEGSTKEWDQRIEDLRAGKLAHRMLGEAAVKAEAKPVSIPTKCSACSGDLPAWSRGMQGITCRYCGQEHPLQFA